MRSNIYLPYMSTHTTQRLAVFATINTIIVVGLFSSFTDCTLSSQALKLKPIGFENKVSIYLFQFECI